MGTEKPATERNLMSTDRRHWLRRVIATPAPWFILAGVNVAQIHGTRPQVYALVAIILAATGMAADTLFGDRPPVDVLDDAHTAYHVGVRHGQLDTLMSMRATVDTTVEPGDELWVMGAAEHHGYTYTGEPEADAVRIHLTPGPTDD